MSEAIEVKGLRDGVLITLHQGELAALLAELTDLIDTRKSFFQGGQVAVQVGARRLERDELIGLCRIFSQRGVALSALLSEDQSTRSTAVELGLRTQLAPPREAPPEAEPTASEELDTRTPEAPGSQHGVLVERTLRSGQAVHSAGHVVVLGDVNPGAEVIAGGDVIVWGRLRGIVHAGAMGDLARCVCALELSPTQLRIGNHIARPPEEKRRRKKTGPERAFVNNDQIIAEGWR